MIKHIVLFKLKNFQSEAEKAEKMNEIKVKLEALKSKIDFLRDIRVDICCNPKEELTSAWTQQWTTWTTLLHTQVTLNMWQY